MIHFYNKKIDEDLRHNEANVNNFNNVNIGNKISTYANEEERIYPKSLLAVNNINNNLHQIIQDKMQKDEPLSILDLACGNGNNSRVIVRALNEIYPSLKFKIYLADITSILLEEAEVRYSRLNSIPSNNISTELIQISFTDLDSISKFTIDYKDTFDFIFSIKFLHNVNIKINSNIANTLSTTLKENGLFLIQYYNHTNLKNNIKSMIKFFLGKKYAHSIFLDRMSAERNLKKYGFRRKYYSIHKTNMEINPLNHFINNYIEAYYTK